MRRRNQNRSFTTQRQGHAFVGATAGLSPMSARRSGALFVVAGVDLLGQYWRTSPTQSKFGLIGREKIAPTRQYPRAARNHVIWHRRARQALLRSGSASRARLEKGRARPRHLWHAPGAGRQGPEVRRRPAARFRSITLLVIKCALAKDRPHAAAAIVRLFSESKRAAGLPAPDALDMNPVGRDTNHRNLEVAIDCAYRQRMIARRFEAEELFA